MKKLNLLVTVCALLVFGYTAISTVAARRTAGESIQDPAGLDRRITSLETRLFSIESNMRLLEQQISISSRTNSMPRQEDPEIQILQRQVLILQSQLDGLRCGVAKIDERTLAPSRRLNGQGRDTGSDPCRTNPDTPVLTSPIR